MPHSSNEVESRINLRMGSPLEQGDSRTSGHSALRFESRAWAPWVLGLILAIGVLLAYSNSLDGPWQYDDAFDIRDNLTIRQLWPLNGVFYKQGSGFMSRPIANLSFAINYATGGLNTAHYHLTNLGIHLGASLALLGILRRAFSLPSLKEFSRGNAETLALVTAAFWALHPLLTESVTYITQRYESLMGLFVFLTFYSALRGSTSRFPQAWAGVAFMACLLALGSKEVAVSLPVLVLLFDRTFLAGSFLEAWRQRRSMYLGFMLAWCCFLFIQLNVAARSFAGFGLEMPWWRYAINQPPVILHYIRLAIWPHPLNFDYFWPAAKSWTELAPGFVVIGCVLLGTLWAYFMRPKAAFLPIFFFLILAPTSSVMPILDLAVEHRMYLPLAPVVVLLVFSVSWALDRLLNRGLPGLVRPLAMVLVGGLLATFGTLTYLRNEDYRNPTDLWRDAVTKSPKNPRAHHNYAYALAEEGNLQRALQHYYKSIELAPKSALYHSNCGMLLGRMGRPIEGLERVKQAVRLNPTNWKFVFNLGVLHAQKGSEDNAVACYHAAMAVDPQAAMPYSALASVHFANEQWREALELVNKAIDREPHRSAFWFQRGLILLRLGNVRDARTDLRMAIIRHAIPEKMASNVGWAYHEHGLDKDAVHSLRLSLRLNPGFTESQVRLAWILATSWDDQVRSGSEALAIVKSVINSQGGERPEFLDVMAVSFAELGQFQEAAGAIESALSQSKDRSERWVPDQEMRLGLFRKSQPFRDPVKFKVPPESEGK